MLRIVQLHYSRFRHTIIIESPSAAAFYILIGSHQTKFRPCHAVYYQINHPIIQEGNIMNSHNQTFSTTNSTSSHPVGVVMTFGL